MLQDKENRLPHGPIDSAVRTGGSDFHRRSQLNLLLSGCSIMNVQQLMSPVFQEAVLIKLHDDAALDCSRRSA